MWDTMRWSGHLDNLPATAVAIFIHQDEVVVQQITGDITVLSLEDDTLTGTDNIELGAWRYLDKYTGSFSRATTLGWEPDEGRT